MSLPEGHPNKWKSFENYLIYYNGKYLVLTKFIL